MIYFLKLEEVIKLHDRQIELFGGSFGVRDQNLLKSAIQMPKQSFGDEFLHKFPFEMAGAYLFHISKNHAFVDGNKRTAIFCTEVFLEINGFEITANEKDLENLVLETATGKLDKKQIAEFFAKNCKKN